MKNDFSNRRAYAQWLREGRIELSDLRPDVEPHSFAPDSVFIAGTALEVADSFIAVGLDRPAPDHRADRGLGPLRLLDLELGDQPLESGQQRQLHIR